MRHLSVAVALWLGTSAYAAEEANPLEKSIRRDVPDALLDGKALPGPKTWTPNPEMKRKAVEEVQRMLNGGGAFVIEPKGPKEDAEARQKIKDALERKLTFEFTDTPLDEAVGFLKTLTRVEIAYDASVLAAERNKTPVNLKAAELQLEAVLTRICKTADLKWEIRGTSIVIFAPAADRGDENRARDERNPMPKIRAKLADGTEIEADAPLLNMPGVGQAILDRILDPAKDGILAFRLGRDLEPQSFHYLKMVLPKVGPNCTLEVQDQDLVLIQSESPGELRKILALMRALRPEGQRPPPPGERARRPMPPPGPPDQQQQPKKAREEAPGQF